MRVLMQNRVDAFTNAGGQVGDVEMMRRTAEALEKLGVKVDLATEPDPPLAGYDLVHLFNLTLGHEMLHRTRRAVKAGLPVVMSPLWLDYTELNRFGRYGMERWLYKLFPSRELSERVKALLRLKNPGLRDGTMAILLRGEKSVAREVLAHTDMLLPNSPAEGKAVEHLFGVKRPSQVVWIGVNEAPKVDEKPFVETYGMKDFLFCVGSLQARKNQISLVRAMAGTDIPLVMSGNPVLGQEAYLAELQREAQRTGAKVMTIKERDMLYSAYAACRVHALVSWVETTGLVSLEAAQMGARIVSTDRGFTRDYFDDNVWYCDPSSEASIREACLGAWAAGPKAETGPLPQQTRLLERAAREFTWEASAKATLEGYKMALEKKVA